MRLSRPAAVAGAALLLGALGFSTADAAATLSKSNLLPAGETIDVAWSGLSFPGSNTTVYIQQCFRDDSGPFNQLNDCSQATGINPDDMESPAAFNVFGGQDPNGKLWACGSKSVVAGVTKYPTCFVRLAPGLATNTATDEFYPVTFTGVVSPPNDVPEVPLNVLLPLGAAAVLGGSVIVARRRQNTAA